MRKLDNKGELRLHHIIIAVIAMALFGIFLFSTTTTFITQHSNGTITAENLTSPGEEGNRTRFYNSINKIDNMTGDIMRIGKSAPGGEDSASSVDALEAEGSLLNAGLKFIANIGNWLFVYPLTMIGAMFGFLGLPDEFYFAAGAILVLVVGIILVSSLLKNRL